MTTPDSTDKADREAFEAYVKARGWPVQSVPLSAQDAFLAGAAHGRKEAERLRVDLARVTAERDEARHRMKRAEQLGGDIERATHVCAPAPHAALRDAVVEAARDAVRELTSSGSLVDTEPYGDRLVAACAALDAAEQPKTETVALERARAVLDRLLSDAHPATQTHHDLSDLRNLIELARAERKGAG